MRPLWLLTIKNLKLLIRAKSSALIVVFAPLLIILILSLSYNNSQVGLNVGVYAPEFGAEVESFISLLQEQDFKIVKYDLSVDDCVGDLRSESIHTCISLPGNFQVEGNTPKEVVFYIDPSRINLVWMIQEVVGSQFDFKSQQVSQSLTQNILNSLSETKNAVASRTTEVGSIQEKVSSASSSASSAKSSLGNVDTALTETPYSLELVTAVNTNLGSAKTKLGEALTAIESANISSGKTPIKAAVESAQKEVDNALVSFSGEGQSIEVIIHGLQSDLNSAKTKLASASSAISSSSSSLESVNSALQESITALNSVQTGLSGMKEKLDAQKVMDAGTITAPLVTKIKKVSEEGTFLNYSFPALLILVLMFSSLLLGTTLVMMEKNSPAFFRNYFLPLRKTTFIISTYLTNLILIVIQLAIILGISLFFLEELASVLPLVMLILFLSASVFTFLGMALGYVFVSEETGVLASISLGSLLLFFSGVILPLESVSPTFREIAFYNPFVLSEKLVREVFIFDASLGAIWTELLILAGYAVILFLAILLAESFLHKHLLNRLMQQHKMRRQNEKAR